MIEYMCEEIDGKESPVYLKIDDQQWHYPEDELFINLSGMVGKTIIKKYKNYEKEFSMVLKSEPYINENGIWTIEVEI